MGTRKNYTPFLNEHSDPNDYIIDTIANAPVDYGSQMSKGSPASTGVQSDMDKYLAQQQRSDITRAAMSGAQSGGLSGALTSGGVSAMLGAENMEAAMGGMGPYAIAGGLVLSQIEAAQKAKAAQEQERIANEKGRRGQMLAQFNRNANLDFNV